MYGTVNWEQSVHESYTKLGNKELNLECRANL